MRLRVQIQPTALADAEEYAVFIRDEKQDPIAALRWYDGLMETILSLKSMQSSYPVILEQDSFRISLRHLHYHSHRVIFHPDEDAGIVYVLRIYHGARDAIRAEGIELP